MPPRIGYLAFGGPSDAGSIRLREEFEEGLRENRYVDGVNIVIDYRYATGDIEQLRALAREFVNVPVDVVLAADSQSVSIAAEATQTIPIVMALFSDPVGAGLARSLARPGKNVTGLSNLNRPLAGKRLELLRDIVPGLTRPAVLWNAEHDGVRLQWQETQRVAADLGLELISLPVRRLTDFDEAFGGAAREGAEALLVLPDPLTIGGRKRIVALAAEQRLPDLQGATDAVDDGALMALAADRFAMMRRAPTYVAKILHGTPAGELPIEQSTRFEMVINLRTARALGITLPQEVLWEAARVVD